MTPHTRKLAALTAACVLAFGIAQPAHALFGIGDIVLDPTNLVQNTLTAVRTLEQINNQIRQLQNEAQMLINQARNLASLPSSVVGQLRANLATTQRLIAQAKGLAYDVTNLDREFQRLYPAQYAATKGHVQSYTIAGRTMQFRSVAEIRELIAHYKDQVTAETSHQALLAGGSPGRVISKL